jgi:hypothetical protein
MLELKFPNSLIRMGLTAALILLPVAASQAEGGGPRAGAGCRGLEQALGVLDWTGPGFGRGLDWRETARETLARRYADRCVALNQVQVLGSHNSYHIQPRPRLLGVLVSVDPELMELEYTHLPLDQQFETQGIRQIELDVFVDPEGGRYAYRVALPVIGDDPYGPLELDEPGIKVFHVQELDFETTCLSLVQCLATVQTWSAQHPGHLPLLVLIEAKDEAIPDPLNLGFVQPLPFGPEEFRDVDDEILSVFPRSQLLLPDDVRGDRETLEEAVLEDGWPRLGEARGRVLFALDNGGSKRLDYLDGQDALEGRVLFTNSFPGQPDAAFVKLNDPVADAALIPEIVRAGYIVRTRADAKTEQARTGDTTRRDAALASGAQFVSTDYPVPNPDFGTGYFVEIPDGEPGRCNPINAPPGCRAGALEIP